MYIVNSIVHLHSAYMHTYILHTHVCKCVFLYVSTYTRLAVPLCASFFLKWSQLLIALGASTVCLYQTTMCLIEGSLTARGVGTWPASYHLQDNMRALK